jgi:hypothetical protein
VLLGFRPQWRGQPFGTFRVLFIAVLYGAPQSATGRVDRPHPQIPTADIQPPRPQVLRSRNVRMDTRFDTRVGSTR